MLDGPDGGGKTTQAARLADWLRERGFDVVTCRDPGGTALGNRLRAILMDRDTVPISIRAEMLLFMASRAQMVEEIIRPALESGHVVVCDRFLLATIVYQGYAGGLDPAEVAAVGTVGDRRPAAGPDDRAGRRRRRPPGTGSGRARPDRGSARGLSGARPRRVISEAAPGDVARSYPAPVALVDATYDPDTVFELISREVMLVLALDPRA